MEMPFSRTHLQVRDPEISSGHTIGGHSTKASGRNSLNQNTDLAEHEHMQRLNCRLVSHRSPCGDFSRHTESHGNAGILRDDLLIRKIRSQLFFTGDSAQDQSGSQNEIVYLFHT